VVIYKVKESTIWSLSKGTYIFFEPSVISTLNSFRQKQHQTEAGGCLFGYYRGDHIHVSDCTTPQTGDVRRPNKFLRKDKFHLTFAKHLYEKTGHTCTYLGDWHTHPQSIPTPSHFDYSEWDKITNLKGQWITVAVIVGTTSLWVGCGSVKKPIRKNLSNYDDSVVAQ